MTGGRQIHYSNLQSLLEIERSTAIHYRIHADYRYYLAVALNRWTLHRRACRAGGVSAFGDYEPEDAWDPGDPLPLLIENLLRRLELLEGAVHPRRYGVLLDEIESRLDVFRNAHLPERDRVRFEQLMEDLETLRQRDG